MTSRTFDALASNIDDASMVVEELQGDPATDTQQKLEELHDTLEQASDTIDEIDNKRE
jgi:hypothetical protein